MNKSNKSVRKIHSMSSSGETSSGSVLPSDSKPRRRRNPFHFLIRGLAITLPPVLTLLILIWIGRLLNDYILRPTTWTVKFAIAQFTDHSRPADQFVQPASWMPPLEYVERNYLLPPKARDELRALREKGVASGQPVDQLNEMLAKELREVAYVGLTDDRAVPYVDYAEVAKRLPPQEMPRTSRGLYMELVTTRYFRSLFHLSAVALLLAVLLLYFAGRLVTVRVGAWMVQKFESSVMSRVPLVSQVYSSVKQVTDFFFTERTVEYNRVVAVEYPRRGIWSIGFVTSDSLLEITAAAGEPLVSVLMPTSPMPMTGFTVNVPRSEIIDLNMTIDQAFQYCLSCGVLVPPQQKVTPESLREVITRRLTLPQNALGKSAPGKTPEKTAGTGPSPADDSPSQQKDPQKEPN